MSVIKVRPIEKPVIIHYKNERIVLPRLLRQKIDQHWQKLIEDNPRLHNGEVFTVIAVDETEQKIDVELAETDYAHYLYSHQVGGLSEFTVRIIHSTTLVITKDNKMILGEMGAHTSRPGIIQCCGGGIDHNDITDNVVDIEGNTSKELQEELGLNPYDKGIADRLYPAYFKTGGPTRKMTLIYVLHLKQSSDQFLEHYEAFAKRLKDMQQEPEFGKIFCIVREKSAVKTFMQESDGKLNDYVPALLRTVTRQC